MTTHEVLSKELLALQSEKGNICVSVIVPARSISPERKIEELDIKHAFEKAAATLKVNYETSQSEPLIKIMNDFFKTLDFTPQQYGRGFYISRNIQLTVVFPFPVEEKITVGSSFELRYLLHKMYYSKTYFVLLLTEKENRLYKGNCETLSEITNDQFPVIYEEEYLYTAPSPGSSYGGYAHVKMYEKDKSELQFIRFRDLFRKVDKLLENYLSGDEPLIIMGVEKNLSLFNEITDHQRNIIAQLPGNHSHDRINDLERIAWQSVCAYLNNKTGKIVGEFKERITENRFIYGIPAVWAAAKQGKPLRLLVEKDYRAPGYLTSDESHLYLKPPVKTHRVLDDAVNDIIETVVNKNGQVFFVENKALEDLGHIGLINAE